MTVHIESDEELQGTPRVIGASAAASRGSSRSGETKVSNDIDDYVGNRSGAFTVFRRRLRTPQMPKRSNTDAAGDTYDYTCGYDADDDNFDDDYAIDPDVSH